MSARGWARAAALAGAALVAAEGSARLLTRSVDLKRWESYRAWQSPAFCRLRWLQQRRAGAGLTSMEHHGRYLAHDPERGWKVLPGLRGVEPWKGKSVGTNELGLRGAASARAGERPAGLRVETFGDSFTFGDEVSDEETYPHFLQKRLPGSEVLNFGVSGYGHDQMLLFFRSEGRAFRPDWVVVGFTHPETPRNLSTFYVYAKPRFLAKAGGLALAGAPVPSPDDYAARQAFGSRARDLAAAAWQTWAAGRPAYEKTRKEMTEAILNAFRAEAAEAGGRLLVLHIPMRESASSQAMISASNDPDESWLAGFCSRTGVPLVLARPYLERAGGAPLYEEGSHLTPLGNRLCAEALADALVRFSKT
jgi:lysophospholipase L1-like esterase